MEEWTADEALYVGGALLGMCNLGEGSWKNGPRKP
jgi:hypothetical protein